MEAPGAASSRIVRFAAEDWPPFISHSLPADGMSGAMVSAVFERFGYTVRYEYFPWKRAMQFGLASPRYAGFLAVWRTPEREKLCHFSVPVGNCLLYTSPSPRDQRGSRMPSSA